MSDTINNVVKGHKNKQSYANTRTSGKEQYYTSSEAVDLCLEEVKKHINLNGRMLLEPAGGTGEFIEGFRRIGINDDKIVSFDIEPKHPLVKEGNYLNTKLSNEGYACITNPPFGRASALAKDFFNNGADFCDYQCFLVAKSWRKWTVQNALDDRFHLVADIEMPKNCFYRPEEDGESKKDVLNTVFQIWEKRDYKRKKIVIPDHGLIKKIQPSKKTVTDCHGKQVRRPNKISGANFEIITMGHSAGKCKRLDPALEYEAKTTTAYFTIEREDVKTFIENHGFAEYANNVAYVQALSIEEINYELNKHYKLENFTF